MSNTNERHLAFEWLRNLPVEGEELKHATVLLKEIVRLNERIEVYRTETPLSELELQATIDKLVEAVSILTDDLKLAGEHLCNLGHENKQKYCDGQVKEYRDLINSVTEKK